MAHQVVWLAGALDDVEKIAAHIAIDSPAYASAVVARFLGCARELAIFPALGRCVPEWEDESIREQIVYSYRLIYRIMPAEVEVLAVIHGARLLPEGLRRR